MIMACQKWFGNPFFMAEGMLAQMDWERTEKKPARFTSFLQIVGIIVDELIQMTLGRGKTKTFFKAVSDFGERKRHGRHNKRLVLRPGGGPRRQDDGERDHWQADAQVSSGRHELLEPLLRGGRGTPLRWSLRKGVGISSNRSAVPSLERRWACGRNVIICTVAKRGDSTIHRLFGLTALVSTSIAMSLQGIQARRRTRWMPSSLMGF